MGNEEALPRSRADGEPSYLVDFYGTEQRIHDFLTLAPAVILGRSGTIHDIVGMPGVISVMDEKIVLAYVPVDEGAIMLSLSRDAYHNVAEIAKRTHESLIRKERFNDPFEFHNPHWSIGVHTFEDRLYVAVSIYQRSLSRKLLVETAFSLPSGAMLSSTMTAWTLARPSGVLRRLPVSSGFLHLIGKVEV